MSQPLPLSNAFVNWLAIHRRGQAGEDLFKALQECVAAVRASGGVARLDFQIRLRPAGKGLGDTLIVEDEIKVRLPKPPASPAIYFADDHNQLVRDNPNQLRLELRALPAAIEPAPQTINAAP